LLIGNGNLPIRAGDLELSARLALRAVERPWFYLDNGDAGSPGSGKMNLPVVSEPAAG
jgi:hypothetical protein